MIFIGTDSARERWIEKVVINTKSLCRDAQVCCEYVFGVSCETMMEKRSKQSFVYRTRAYSAHRGSLSGHMIAECTIHAEHEYGMRSAVITIVRGHSHLLLLRGTLEL